MVQNTKDVRYLYVLSNYDPLPDVQDELVTAWFEIYRQWSEIIGGSRSDLTILKHKRMIAMKYKYDVHIKMLNMIEILPLQEFIDTFNEEGYAIDLDDYTESVRKAKSKLNKKKAQIELDEPKKEEEEDKSGNFDSVIGEVAMFQGFGFDQEKTSVRYFANIYKKWQKAGK